MTAPIVIMGAQMAMGKRVDDKATYKGLSARPSFFAVNAKATVLAQNDNTASDENEKSQSGPETDESKATAEEEQKSSKAEPKPLKPFVPSEKIPGDQAVDFPVDI
jgi:hypothetical protein